jgi:uncharacterized protein YjhX (UPF0386 family)
MASPIAFSLTAAQCKVLDGITRPGWRHRGRYDVLTTLERRYLIQEVRGRYRITAPGLVAQELVRMLGLHQDHASQG